MDRLRLYNFLENGARFGCNKCALEYNDFSLSYNELMEEVKRRAEILNRCGVTKCSKVGILLENPYEFILTFFAISYLDGVIMPIYFSTGIEKVDGIVNTYDINIIITTKNLKYERIYENSVNEFIVYFNTDLLDDSLADVSLILFTSGTTNTPKAIMLTNENIYSNVLAISKYLRICEEDKILLIKNLCHASSLIGELFVGLQNGCTVILCTKLPIASTILGMIEKKSISIFFAVPTILKAIILCKNLSEYNLDELRIINFYGASMNQTDIKRLADLLPRCNLIYSYGQTEASPRVTYIERKDLVNNPSSSGRPIQNVKISIVDASNQELPPYKSGEIVVNGPNVMKGYYRNLEKTRKTIVNGWLHTGDIGYVDDKGFLYVRGRSDNMIISFGKNIYLEEIENTIISMPGVAEALVYAIKKDNGTIELCACVVLDNKNLSISEIYDYCIKHLENYKVPKKIKIADSLEKTNSGKTVRNQMINKS